MVFGSRPDRRTYPGGIAPFKRIRHFGIPLFRNLVTGRTAEGIDSFTATSAGGDYSKKPKEMPLLEFKTKNPTITEDA